MSDISDEMNVFLFFYLKTVDSIQILSVNNLMQGREFKANFYVLQISFQRNS